MERSTPAAEGGVPLGHHDDQDEADQEPVAPEEARQGIQPHPLCCTVFSSEGRAKLRDWAVWPVQAGCYSRAAMSSNDFKTLYYMALAHVMSSEGAHCCPSQEGRVMSAAAAGASPPNPFPSLPRRPLRFVANQSM